MQTKVNTADQELWKDIVTSDETLKWTGRPSVGWYFRRDQWPALVISAGLIGVAAIAIYAANEGGAPLWFKLLFALFGVWGLLMVPIQLATQRRRHSRTRYALTDKRALILMLSEPNQLWSYPLAETIRLALHVYTDFGVSVLYFKDVYAKVGNTTIGGFPYEIAFEFLKDGADVQDLMKELGAGKGPEWGKRTKPVELQ